MIDEITTERRRQIEAEGWSPEHDDTHNSGELAVAAACYALWETDSCSLDPSVIITELWPWRRNTWKPKDRRRNLVRAGALIIAEIERLDRAVGGAA